MKLLELDTTLNFTDFFLVFERKLRKCAKNDSRILLLFRTLRNGYKSTVGNFLFTDYSLSIKKKSFADFLRGTLRKSDYRLTFPFRRKFYSDNTLFHPGIS